MKITVTRTRTRVAGLAAALALAAGGTAAAVTVTASGASSHAATPQAAQHQTELAARARASLVTYLKTTKPLADLAPNGLKPGSPNSTAGARGAAQVGSYNWSGYADTSSPGTFTAVSATWREPATPCTPEQRLVATWAGLDGFSDQTVEQAGTLAYCFEGQVTYYTWYELYPAATVTVGSTVRPGDLISVSVTRSGTSYTLTVTDHNSPPNSFTTVQSCSSCQNSSAEWITERPAFSSTGITPLAVFTPWLVTKGSQTANGVRGSIGSGPGATQIIMVDSTATYALDSISGLSSRGSIFSARWLNSY
jgi:Peptidase A4 family